MMPKLNSSLFSLTFQGEEMTPESFAIWLLLSGQFLPTVLYSQLLKVAKSYGISEDAYRIMIREGDHRAALFPSDVPSIISDFHNLIRFHIVRSHSQKYENIDVLVAALTYIVDVWNSNLTTKDDFIELTYPKIGTQFEAGLMQHDSWDYSPRRGTHIEEVLLPGIPSLNLLPTVYLQDLN